MSDNDKNAELKKIEGELKGIGLSRRNFLSRLSAVGVGFGAALALGLRGAEAATQAGVDVSSVNPAVDKILSGSKQAETPESEPPEQVAYYHRVYRRGYRRFGPNGLYHRVYRRGYNRAYRRFAPGYSRFYVRF
jgi:hypothetical protein